MRYVDFGGDGEYDDQVVSAIERACDTDPRTALRLVAEYSGYWWSSGLQDEAAAAAERVLSILGRTVPVGLDEEYLLAVLHGAASAEQEQLELAQQIVATTTGPFKYSVTVLLWASAFVAIRSISASSSAIAFIFPNATSRGRYLSPQSGATITRSGDSTPDVAAISAPTLEPCTANRS